MPKIRLPDPNELDEILSGVDKRSEMAERKLKKAIGNALAAMSPSTKAALMQGLTLGDAALQALLQRDRLSTLQLQVLVAVIRKMQELDDSGLSLYPGVVEDVRPLTDVEHGHLQVLAAEVTGVMRKIATGHFDDQVNLVFDWDCSGGHGAHAKKVFRRAADALDRLVSSKQVVADVMRKQDVWACGGLTRADRMALPESVVRGLATARRGGLEFLTLVHESTHALKKGATTDVLYEHHENFTTADPEAKKATADYYKVVARLATVGGRVSGFVPRSADAHLATTRSKELVAAATQVDKLVNGAWVTAIRLHDTVLDIANRPSAYHTFRGKYEDWLASASKLMGLTLHREKTLVIHTYTSDPATKISTIDLATMDNKIAILAACNGKAKHVLAEPVDALDQTQMIDYVIRAVLDMFVPGQRLTKSREKDIKLIRILGGLHESVGGKNGLVSFDPLPAIA